MGFHVVKYMGSKRGLLSKGLGEIIIRESRSADRVVDLFSGSGAVGIYVAERVPIPVLSVDLQHYATSLAAGVISRTTPVDPADIVRAWIEPAIEIRESSPLWAFYISQGLHRFGAETVRRSRLIASKASPEGFVHAYGGHYYSLSQAATFDALIEAMPTDPAMRSICVASLIHAGSHCAAAPGHTAQPFQPTRTALPFIQQAWKTDPVVVASQVVNDLALRYALAQGETRQADANTVAMELCDSDVAIVDPPYSAVQYSRFYHVLESLSLGRVGAVSGAGRYVSRDLRPQSSFSLTTGARIACESLLSTLAQSGCSVILTYPVGTCSNGLSGRDIVEIAAARFKVSEVVVHGHFSTLGGNGTDRAARQASEELVISMVPRRRRNAVGRKVVTALSGDHR